MGKGIFSSAKSYCKNVGIHLWEVARRRETASEAFSMLGTDSKKLAHTVSNAVTESRADEKRRKKAKKLLDIGRAQFNEKRYESAMKTFRHALGYDPHCVWAQTYLGYALYHAGDSEAAIAAWEKAYAMDPASEAGLKAQQKLRHVEKRKQEVIETLTERMEPR